MVKQKIIWSSLAYNQRKEILSYWLKRNNSSNYSKKLLKEIQVTIQSIADYSLIGNKTDIDTVLVFVMGNYSIYYQINEIDLRILCFWDNRRNPNLLNDLI